MNEEELQLYKYLNGLISYPFTRDSRNKILEMFKDLQKQLEAYENMRKEAIEYAKNSIDLLKPPCVSTINEEEYAPYIIIHDNYLNILNKVGGSDE